MIRRQVLFSPEARADLDSLFDWIAEAASPVTAMKYIARLEAYLAGFDIAAERGTRRDDIRPGLRIVGFERRITIAFTVNEAEAVILRLLYGGQNWSEVLAKPWRGPRWQSLPGAAATL